MSQKSVEIGLRISGFLLAVLLVVCTRDDAIATPVGGVSDEAGAEAQSAQRYLTALLRNPRPGTAFDRVYAWHADRGSAGRFQDSLLQFAIQSGAVDSSILPAVGAPSVTPESPDDSAEILPLPPGSAGDAALILAALIDLRHGEPQSATVLLTRAAELRPKDSTTRWMLARALDQSEQSVAAADAFEAALSLRPPRVDLAEIHRDYAESLQRQRKPEEALQVWQRLEQAFPGDRRVLRQVARALSRDGRWTDALKRYEQLAATADETEERITAELEVCDALQQLERRPEALTRLQALLPELDPDAWLYRDVRARIEQLHRAADDLTGLAQYYTTWLSGHPEDLDVMQRLARVLQELGRGEEARHWLTQALDRAPDNSSLRNAFIAALQSAGRTAEAAVRLQEWLEAGPAAPAQWQQLGLLQLARTDLALPARQELAAAAFEQFVTQADNDPRQLRQAADLLERAGQFARAEELLRTSLAASAEDAAAREALGLFLHRRQRSSEALEVWNQLAAGSLKTPESLGQLADLLQRNGFVPQAVAARREACRLNPGLNDRLRFVELLLIAAEAGAAAAQDHFTEALGQLDLADTAASEATERERVLELRVRVLLASDGLTQAIQSERQRITRQSATAAGTVTAADYRRLCAYESAAGQISAAAAACLEVVQLEPASIADWSLLVQLCERAGQTGDAASALQKLMQLDRRGWSGYQQQLVRLELRQGRPEAALAAATELTRATPGSVEAWQFLAETAFAAGQPAQGVEALRRAVRASPGDVTALRSLARTLADEFQTAEALELSWRAFEQSADGQERQELAAFLAQLALRSGRWTATHERLEQWLRIQPDALDAARAAASFFREAGRFSEARAVLEPLLHADPENSTLLTEIANLAERERRADLAIEYLLRLYRSTGSLQDLRRLLLSEPAALKQAGCDAHQLLAEAAAAAVSRTDFHAVIQLGLSRQLQSAALQLCLERLQRDPEDWWSLYQAARLTGDLPADNTHTPNPQELRLQLLNLPLSPGSTAAVSQAVNAAPPVTTPQPATATPTEPEVQRIWRQAAAATPDSDNGPAIFAESLVLAARDQLRAAGSAGLPGLLESAAVRLHGAEFLQACVAVPDGEILTAESIDRLLQWSDQRVEPAASELRLRLLQQRLVLARRSETQAATADLEQRLANQALKLLETSPETLTESAVFDPRQLRSAARNLWRAGLLKLAAAGIAPQAARSARIPILLNHAVQLHDAELFATVFDRLSADTLSPEHQLHLQRVCEQAELAGWVAEASDLSVLKLLLRFLFSDTVWQNEDLSVRLLTTAQPGALQFRHQPGPASARERLISACLGRSLQLWRGTVEELWLELFGSRPELTPWAATLLRAELQRLRGVQDPLLRELAAAASINRREWNLRLWLAELLPGIGLIDEALELLSQLPRTEAKAAIDAELLALNICLAADRQERAREAAVRLSGLPLSEVQQQRLIPVLGRLQLPDVLRAVEVRLGRSSETRTGVLARRLQAAQAAGNRALSGELAWELLRLSSGGSLFSGYRPTDDRDDGGERVLALRALAQSGRAGELSERYEAMLAAAPDALPLLELLAELDDAAGNREQLARRQDQIAALTGRASPGRRRRALELENSGDVSAACDEYLEILREDPETFAAEAETFFQAFERSRRTTDFLRGVLQLDADFWRQNGRLLATATAAAANAATRNPADVADAAAVAAAADAAELVQKSATRLLAEADTRRLGLGMLMNLPGLLTDDQVQQGFRAELQRLARPPQSPQGTQTELLAACSELLQLTASLERRELLRDMVAGAAEPGRSAAARVFSMVVAAQLGEATLFDEAAMRLMADETGELADSPELFAELVVLLQQRLAGLGSDWNAPRERLLRRALESGLAAGTAGEQLRLALAELLQQTGRSTEARQLLLARLLAAGASVDGQSATGVRELLRTAEQVQHSGYPAEAAELLSSVSPHDLQQFTKSLDPDRVATFRSRWNAALQWSVRQMTPERLVAWLETQLEAPPALASPQPGARPRNPLLLVPDGPGDPAETDPERLQELFVQSLLLESAWRGEYVAEELRGRIRGLAGRVLEQSAVNPGVLCATAALADRAECIQERDRLLARLLEIHGPLQAPQPAASQNPRRTQGDEFASLQVAGLVQLGERLLADGRIDPAMAERLWETAVAAADNPGPRLVRLAVLNRAAGAAVRAGRTATAERFRQKADTLIAEQQRAGARAEAAAGTLAEVIRRLLKDQ